MNVTTVGRQRSLSSTLFCECDMTSGIWQDILDWLEKQTIRTEYLTDIQITFGVINKILVTTKMIIFKNKGGGRSPRLAQVIASLKSQFKTERFIATNNNKDRFFRGFWSPIWDKVSEIRR